MSKCPRYSLSKAAFAISVIMSVHSCIGSCKKPHYVLPECAHTPIVHLLQDLCVKIDSTEGMVLLVLEIQGEEELIAQAIKEKKVKQVQQELQKMQVR